MPHITSLLTALVLAASLSAAEPALAWNHQGMQAKPAGDGVSLVVDRTGGNAIGMSTAKLPAAYRKATVTAQVTVLADVAFPNFTILLGSEGAWAGGGVQLGPNEIWIASGANAHSLQKPATGKTSDYQASFPVKLTLDLDTKQASWEILGGTVTHTLASVPAKIDSIGITSYTQGATFDKVTVVGK